MPRQFVRVSRSLAGVAAVVGALLAAACIQAPVPPVGGTPQDQLARLEAQYADTRDLYFQIYVTDARGTGRNERGMALADMKRAHRALRERVAEGLDALETGGLSDEDRSAVRTMRRQLVQSASIEAGGDADASAPGGAPGDSVRAPSVGGGGGGGDRCRYDPGALAMGDSGLARLSARIYDCYGAQATRVVTPTDTADRLTVLGRLATEESPDRRRALFLSLAPVWRSVIGDGSPASPYRTMLRLSAERWRRDGSPVAEAARSLGMDPQQVEPALVRILSAWRDHVPPPLVEPWDWYFENGAASRILSPSVPREALRDINDSYYRDNGADPMQLGIRYELEPRDGKTPVAFTQFGHPARRGRDGWGGAEAWVFATYRTGGFDNLVELLHETGHAIHISAVATRPAFADWPDSDPFTEALGDLLALEAYEPEWQQRYLRRSAPVAVSMRAKYAGIAMDVAWALLELRLHADPTRDPNAEWAAITSSYLRIAPHPEWGWWAMRGQLIDSPGYMMNYALGAMVVAELRDKARQERGPFARPDKKRYAWLSERLYRFGLSRPTREVLRDVLGKPLGTEALVNDMRRLGM